MELPHQGLTADAVGSLVATARAEDAAWRDGRTWSLVYEPPERYAAQIASIASTFTHENALSHHAFPSVSYFESRVVSMVASLVGGSGQTRGVFSSGGTESLLLAAKAYRDSAARAGRDEILVPTTAHPAYAKAAQLLGLGIKTVATAADGTVEAASMTAAMTADTLFVGLSAPNFPYGGMDPIAAVATAAKQRGAGLHVDAALGGMFLPFLDPPYRFALDVPGVTSVSVDLHKFGYAPKGASVVLFADDDLRRNAYFVWTEWPGGAFASASILGTRSVAPAAGAFAALVTLGRDGYQATARAIMATTEQLQRGLVDRGWSIIGEPCMSVFAASPPDPAGLGGVVAAMGERGWRLDAIPQPPALHFVVAPRHADGLAAFFADLDEVTHTSTARPDQQVASYGVMVRGGPPTVETLVEHLDQRYDEVVRNHG
jgi:glutamate/tyrosine decarboxylase-like PLP-dependent enzyme